KKPRPPSTGSTVGAEAGAAGAADGDRRDRWGRRSRRSRRPKIKAEVSLPGDLRLVRGGHDHRSGGARTGLASTGRSHGPLESGAPGETRTPDLLVRSQPLYPPELRARAHHDSSSPYPSATTGFTSSAEPIGQAWIRDGCASYINAYEEYHGNGTSMAGLNPRITVEPGKMGGKPCIRGLRFTVYDLASYLASGMTEDEILKDFPY